MFGAPRDDARLRDFKPKLEQFTMDTRRAPKRVLDAHPPDQRTQARINLGVALPVAGPTGIHLVAELRKTTAAVRVVARGMDKFARLFPDAAVEKRPADILDDAATLRALDGCDLVYDCIGLPGDQMHLHPVTARNIASALRHTKARVQVSSYWAYYPQVRAEMNESHHAHSRQPHELSEWSIRAA